MQTRDEAGNTLWSEKLSDDKDVRDAQIQQALAQPNVNHVAIGSLPNKGDTFTLNGLHYVVKFVDYKRGEIRIKMFTPIKQF
jgi:hypothetical protein